MTTDFNPNPALILTLTLTLTLTLNRSPSPSPSPGGRGPACADGARAHAASARHHRRRRARRRPRRRAGAALRRAEGWQVKQVAQSASQSFSRRKLSHTTSSTRYHHHHHYSVLLPYLLTYHRAGCHRAPSCHASATGCLRAYPAGPPPTHEAHRRTSRYLTRSTVRRPRAPPLGRPRPASSALRTAPPPLPGRPPQGTAARLRRSSPAT